MVVLLTAVVVAFAVWWFGTGLLLLLNRLSPSTFGRSLLGTVVCFGVAVAGVEVSQQFATSPAAYAAFACAVALWGCLELQHLLGALTGPVREACPPQLRGWPRLKRAIGVGLYHDLAIIAVGSLLWLFLWDSANQVAAWTFTTLWVMRWSAKINLYLGMPNLDMDLVPERLRYVATYMTNRPMNAFFPLSLVGGVLLVVFHLQPVWDAGGGFIRTSGLLLGSLTALAVLEHILMVLPIRDSGLWRWALPAKS